MKEKMTGFKIFRSILSPIYKFWYHPVVIGAENIPKEGPILLVGNHIHVMDQCNIVIVTKRCLHYMAKKEYFDNKKVAWFFKLAGCIPVDRSKKDREATAAALEVLKKGQALGLFPEGTRNGVKEEKAKEYYEKYFQGELPFKEFYTKIKKNKTSLVQYLEDLKDKEIITEKEFKENIYEVEEYLWKLIHKKKITKKDYYNHILLPLKFGAVSMAHKTNAVLVPYGITGDYKFHSKNLTVRIGKPFEVGDDLEKANAKLDQAIKELIQENEKNIGK